jgi:CRISPR system Cascade subunit CasE
MSAPLFLTRAARSSDVSAQALIQLIAPRNKDERTSVSHKLMWTLFGDHESRVRDFLWREDADGTFYILSAREPVDAHNLFDVEHPKPFAPRLAAGDRLHFSLRANPTVTRETEDPSRKGGMVKKHCDVIMDALHAFPKGEERAKARRDIEQHASRQWLDKQGHRAGFQVISVDCLGYETVKLPHRGRTIELGVVDLEGTLEVNNPDLFLPALRQGFGRAKAYGCGLMLIRRAI